MITELKLKWIKKINPDYKATLFEDEYIRYPKVWNFDELQWTEKNARITRECGMIPIEADNLIFVGWGNEDSDFAVNLILTQFMLTDWIEGDSIRYLRLQKPENISSFIGQESATMLYEAIKSKRFDI